MYHYGAGTNVGNVRDNNEDSFVCDDEKDLWIVADGMGGLGFGEVASAITTYTVTRQVREGHGINQAIELAHKNIKQYAESDGLGTNMGTTIVLLLSHGSLYNIFWVGDSRAYLFDQEQMKQITIDHSLVQSLIDQGELTREEATTDPRKNAVTRALGVQELETVRADSISERWKPGQKILLCSDGLTDCVSDSDIEKIMRQGGDDQEITDRLIEAALEGGGKDNVTVIVVSAPLTAKIADTDTHVPAGLTGDDTHVPRLDDTLSRSNSPQASLPTATTSTAPTTEPQSQQLSLAITPRTNTESAQHELYPEQDLSSQQHINSLVDDSKPAAQSTHAKKTESDTRPARFLGQMALAAALLVAVMIYSLLPEESAAPSTLHFQPGIPVLTNEPTNLNPHGDGLIAAFDESAFNYANFEQQGTTLQVGLFTQLKGAESQQFELSKLGLSPHIEKRMQDGAVRYAVMIGPLLAPEQEQTLAKLEANEVTYFRTGVRGT